MTVRQRDVFEKDVPLVFYSLLRFPPPGIQKGCSCGNQHQNQNHNELEHGQPQEGQRQNHQAADGPDLARQPMGIGPVVLVSQGPGQANAHGIGLFALGQVVAHRQEHQAQEQTSHQVDVHRQRQGLGIGHSPAEQRDQRANPQQ